MEVLVVTLAAAASKSFGEIRHVMSSYAKLRNRAYLVYTGRSFPVLNARGHWVLASNYSFS